MLLAPKDNQMDSSVPRLGGAMMVEEEDRSPPKPQLSISMVAEEMMVEQGPTAGEDARSGSLRRYRGARTAP